MNGQPDLSEAEEIQQAIEDIEGGCCYGEASETGSAEGDWVPLLRDDATSGSEIRKEILDKLVKNGTVVINRQPHPVRKDLLRPVYQVNKSGRRESE